MRIDSTIDAPAARARTRAARGYLLRVRPGVLALLTLLTAVSWLIEPDNVPPGIWLVCGAFWLIQGLWMFVLRTGVDPKLVAGLSLVVDGALDFIGLAGSPQASSAASSIVFFIVAASYFLPAWATIAYSATCAVALTALSQVLDDWGSDHPFPSVAFTALITGGVCAYVMSRVRRTEQELERLAADEAAARTRLEQIDRVRDRLIASVSHELRTPLTVTIGSIETLLRDDVVLDAERERTLLTIARDGGRRLLALVEDLLTLGATRPDSLDLSTDSELLGAIVQEAIVGISVASGAHVQITVVEDPVVQVDRLRMLQVISNLVVNAIHHGRGTVVVEVSRGSDGARLRVIDDGEGVAPENVAELFLPFSHFSSRADSTGLGLAICRTIVEAHGGTIQYERTEDDRTSFTVELPLTA